MTPEKAPVAEVVENDKENELSDLTDFTDASQNWINNRIGGANKVILERDLRVNRYFYSHAILLINIINKLNTAINKLYLWVRVGGMPKLKIGTTH